MSAFRRTIVSACALVLAAFLAVIALDVDLDIVLRPVEDDASQRALIIAAGAGDVSRVRTLLSQGVRPEPETFNAAIIGAFEPLSGRSACARRTEVARMLLDANPSLRPGPSARAHVFRSATWIRGCDEVTRLIGN